MTEGTGGITMTPPGRYIDNTHGSAASRHPRPAQRAGELQISGHYVARYLEDAGPGRSSFPYPESPEKDFWLADRRCLPQAPAERLFPDRRPDQGHLQEQPRRDGRPAQGREQVRRRPGLQARPFWSATAARTTSCSSCPTAATRSSAPALDGGERTGILPPHRGRGQRRPAPYERVVNFALLDRDFDGRPGRAHGQGLLQPQGRGAEFRPPRSRPSTGRTTSSSTGRRPRGSASRSGSSATWASSKTRSPLREDGPRRPRIGA